MKTPEILHELNTAMHAVESSLLTTIHLINGDKIMTDTESADDEIDYDMLRDFFCSGF